MKSTISIILFLFVSLFTSGIAAAEQNYFSEFASKPGYQYVFISPEMLSILGNQVINNSALNNISITADQIKSVEVLQASSGAEDEELWKQIRKIKETNKLKTLSTKQNSSMRYDILGTMSSNGKYISKLLIVTQKGSRNVSVVYLTGSIRIEALQHAISL